jgi:tRNA G18 (ribose-2'-O)-methylase SpoU
MKSRQFAKSSRQVVVIAHNIRSILNVGAIFRTCEGFGVKKLYLSGYTPALDHGLPHVRAKISAALHKTALGAEKSVASQYVPNLPLLIEQLRADNFRIVGLEQDVCAVALPQYQPPEKVALLLGEEVAGLTPELRDLCDDLVELPMFGAKESFNVSVATGIALYALTVN